MKWGRGAVLKNMCSNISISNYILLECLINHKYQPTSIGDSHSHTGSKDNFPPRINNWFWNQNSKSARIVNFSVVIACQFWHQFLYLIINGNPTVRLVVDTFVQGTVVQGDFGPRGLSSKEAFTSNNLAPIYDVSWLYNVSLDQYVLGQKSSWTIFPWKKVPLDNCPLDKCSNTNRLVSTLLFFLPVKILCRSSFCQKINHLKWFPLIL